MRKILLAAAGLAILASGAGLALAQQGPGSDGGRQFGLFQADANSDGTVTRQEFDAHRVARFATLDANHDGSLTREEMRAQRGERGERGHRGRRGGGMHSLARADANNDGNITREEFLARPTQMFDRLDANHDGVISTTERPQRPERGERSERRERVNPDSNGDGQFSQAEFMSMGASMFERVDANNDGRVTREEADAARPHRRGQ
jgi:Ca2+-binding EF-hand superfamily protein